MTDEHWCSECKKELDKSKAKYIEAEFPNDKSKTKFDRVWLCEKCAKKKKIVIGGKKISAWQLFQKLRTKGNPNFLCTVHCWAAPVCETYEPKEGRVNCANIAVDPDGKVYCKRRHPGFVVLPQEKSLVDRNKGEVYQEMLGNYCKRMGFKSPADALKTFGLDRRWSLPDPVRLRPVGGDVTTKPVTMKKGK